MSTLKAERMVYAMWRETQAAKEPEQHTRWCTDFQGGGQWNVYTPGVTKCWDCKAVIDAEGACDPDCSHFGTKAQAEEIWDC